MHLQSAAKDLIRLPLLLYRANFGRHVKKTDDAQLWVLMYHRILPKNDSRHAFEEPGMIVEPETFRMHLEWVNRLFTPLKLGEWVHMKNSGAALPKKACVITFDDGWRDNYEYAFPILKETNTPATLFAVSDMLETNRMFWPNRLAHIANHVEQEQLAREPLLAEQGIKGNLRDKETLARAISTLKSLSDEVIIEALDKMGANFAVPAAEASLMTWAELKEMSDSGLVEIGSHTQNHMRLKENLNAETLTKEIIESRQQLESHLGKPVELFCYPNGDVSPLALTTVQKCYQAAVTTQMGINTSANLSSHQIKRIPLHNDISNNALKFRARLA